MLQHTFLMLGLVAVLASAATLSASIDQLTRQTTAVFATVTWAYWGVSAFSVEPVTDAGVGAAQTYVGLTAIGLTAAAVMLLSALRLTFSAASDALDSQEAPINYD